MQKNVCDLWSIVILRPLKVEIQRSALSTNGLHSKSFIEHQQSLFLTIQFYRDNEKGNDSTGIIGCKQWSKIHSTTDELSWRSNKPPPPESRECPHCPHTGDLLKGVTSNSGIFPTRGSSEAPRGTSLHQVFIILSLHCSILSSHNFSIATLFH